MGFEEKVACAKLIVDQPRACMDSCRWYTKLIWSVLSCWCGCRHLCSDWVCQRDSAAVLGPLAITVIRAVTITSDSSSRSITKQTRMCVTVFYFWVSFLHFACILKRLFMHNHGSSLNTLSLCKYHCYIQCFEVPVHLCLIWRGHIISNHILLDLL